MTYINGAGITSLGNCYAYPPKFVPEDEFFDNVDPGTESGALIFLRLSAERSKRIELRGHPPGGKMRFRECMMIILFRSTKQLSEEAGYDNDTFLDSLITAIEADKNAGAPGTVFSWGEGELYGGEDLQLDVGLPRPI